MTPPTTSAATTSTTPLFNEPTNPIWPINVMVFHEHDDPEEIIKKIKDTEDTKTDYIRADGVRDTTYTSGKHFSTKHYALLFTPGTYKDVRFEVGYYVQMAGLGKSPNDVQFVSDKNPDVAAGPFVEALNKNLKYKKGGTINYADSGLCLDTFWRSAENFTADKCQWAVSQASPLRSVIVNDLVFGDGGAMSSGGFVANALVKKSCDFVANQQWFSRAVHFETDEEPKGGVWNMCYSGCTGKVPAPGKIDDIDRVNTVEPTPKVRVEKPFVSMRSLNGEDIYELVVPESTTECVSGPFLNGLLYRDIRPFNQVKVCKPTLPMDKDNKYDEHDDETYNHLTPADKRITHELQTALDQGKDLVLCPGIFFLSQSLIVRHPNQVILGLGLATLVSPQDGTPCIHVIPKTYGVRIAGLVLEASFQQLEQAKTIKVRSLLEVGTEDIKDAGDPKNPVLLADIFTRVGGSNLQRRKVETDVMIRIHSGNVVGDNLWLWRADHVRLDKKNNEKPNDVNFPYYHQTGFQLVVDGETTKKVMIEECYVKTALEVNGDDVKIYGLFCEHTRGHQLVWTGERGSVTFFQCELPYDVDEKFAKDEYVGYYVDSKVTKHSGLGIGVYCNFQLCIVNAEAGIIIPDAPDVCIESPFTLYLSNKGGIKHTIKVGTKFYGEEVSKDGHGLIRPWIGDQKDFMRNQRA